MNLIFKFPATCLLTGSDEICIQPRLFHQLLIPMRSLAEQFSVSETSLKNYFRGVYGENVSDYLRNLRMNTAAKLLIETKMPISEISTQVGYTKQGKFSAVFKQQFGMNPLEYRRINRLKTM